MATRTAERQIREAIRRAELPYTQVAREVDSLLAVMERSAERAQLLHEALEQKPVATIEARLAELAESQKAELMNALEQQLEVQRRIQRQLDRFCDEMERIVIELETIRGSLVSVSASSDANAQEQLAQRVGALRDEMSAVASGMSAAFD